MLDKTEGTIQRHWVHKTQNETQTKQQQHNITQKAKTTAQHNTES
jgi:hypothetical protein